MIYFVDGLLWVIALALGADRGDAQPRARCATASARAWSIACGSCRASCWAWSARAISPRCCRRRWSAVGSARIPASPGCASPCIGGAFTPGGPVIGFSIGAAALKGGAGTPQVIAYTIAWALFAVQRLFIWEIPVMPPRLVWLRVMASLPLPFLAAAGAMLLGRP